LFLVWTRSREQRFCKVFEEAEPGFRDHALGLGLIFAAVLLHEVGLDYGILATWHASAVLCFYGALTATFGARQLREHLAALVLLLGVIPVPGLLRQQLTLHLQLYSATVNDFVMTACGVGIERSGVILSSNGVNIEIAEARNGMRMLLVIYAVCFAFPLSTNKRTALLLISPLIACILNTSRLITPVALYSFVSEQTGSTFHDVSGWLIPLGAKRRLSVPTRR